MLTGFAEVGSDGQRMSITPSVSIVAETSIQRKDKMFKLSAFYLFCLRLNE